MAKTMKLETAFTKYGKTAMVNFLRGEVTSRVNHHLKVDKILYILESYPGTGDAGYGDNLKKVAERRLHLLKSDSNGKNYLYDNYKIRTNR